MSEPFIHPSAVVDPGATLGPGCRVWHFCHVSAGATLGAKCVLGQNVYIAGTARLGDNVHVQNNVSIYDGVTLESDVFCGPSMVFTNVRTPRSHRPRKSEYSPTHVERGATIGANATIVCGVRLGAYCMVGAGAVVTHDVPPFALVAGTPARRIGWVCACGERLADEPAPRCGACGDAYSREGEMLTRAI